MLKNPKQEVCKAIHDRLINDLKYSGVAIPVYVDIAPKAITSDTYVVIWGYIDNENGNKIGFGFDSSVNVEVYSSTDDTVKHNAVVSSLKGLIIAKKADKLVMNNFYNSVIKDPSSQFLTELTEQGQIQRTILKYNLIVEQK